MASVRLLTKMARSSLCRMRCQSLAGSVMSAVFKPFRS